MTYQTEAERLAAREAFVELGVAIWGDTATFYRVEFDEKFPPLAPVRMTPVREWWVLDAKGETLSVWKMRDNAERDAAVLPGSRVAEVEVREVGSEPEGVPCKMFVNPEYPADKHFWYSRNHPDFPPHYIITPGRFVADGEAPLSRHHERGV